MHRRSERAKRRVCLPSTWGRSTILPQAGNQLRRRFRFSLSFPLVGWGGPEGRSRRDSPTVQVMYLCRLI